MIEKLQCYTITITTNFHLQPSNPNYKYISMIQTIAWIIILLLPLTNSTLYHPLQTPQLSQDNIFQFLHFSDEIILSPNKTLIVHRLKTTSSSDGTIFFLRMLYYSADTEQEFLGVQDIIFLKTGERMPIDDIRTVWLEPDQLVFLSNCTIQVVDVEINETSYAYKLHKPDGVSCLISKSFIDWEDATLSTFYAVDRVYYEQWNYTQDSIVKLTLQDQLSLVNMKTIKNYRYYSSSTYRIGDYFCFITELKDLVTQPVKDNHIYCYSLEEDSQNTIISQIVSNNQQIVKFTPIKNELSAFAVLLINQKKPYILQAVIYHFNFTQSNEMTITKKNLNFQVDIASYKALFQIELSLFYMLQLQNSLGISYFNKTNEKLELFFYGIQDSQAMFYEYSRVQGHNFNTLRYILFLPKIQTIGFIFEKHVFQISTIIKDKKSFETQITIFASLITSILILSSIKIIKQKIFIQKIALIQLRKRKPIIKIALISLLYASSFLIFLSKQPNSIDMNQLKYSFSSYQQRQSQYQISKSSRMIGSYFLQLFNQLFIFQLILLIILQTNHIKQYSAYHLQYHIKHGLNTFTYISYNIFTTIIDCLIHSIALVMFIYVLSHNYCDHFYQVFALDDSIIVCIIITFLDIACSLVIGMIISYVSTNVLPVSIYIVVISSLQYYFSFLHGSSKISNVQYLLCMFWPSFSAPVFLESIYQVNIRYIEDKIEPQIILNASFIKLVVSIGVYVLIVWRMIYLKRIEELIKKTEKIESSILTTDSKQKKITQNEQFTQQFIDQQQQKRQTEPLLSVFIPQKMNLKHRLQKNKVLNNIKFTAQKGQIISFIDIEHQSKNALMKILLNQQKSDPIINMKLFGHITYKQKLSISYCYEKDIYFPELTIKEHLSLYHSLKEPKMNFAQRELSINFIMDQFNIPEEYQNKKSKYLSGGYLKKMCLACAFIGQPSLIILQEPTVGLDLRFQRIFWNKLKQWKVKKLIIVFTSNNNEAEAISDKIWHFQKAKIYNFFQLKNRNKRMDFFLEFFTKDLFIQSKQIIDKYIFQTKDICNITTNDENQYFSIVITSFKIDEQSSISYLLDLLSKLGQISNQQFNVHYRIDIRECIINSQQMLKQLRKNSCNFCDRERIIQYLQQQNSYNQESKLVYRSQLSENSFSASNNNEQVLSSLPSFDKSKHNYLWMSQIESVIIYKWYHFSQQNMKMKIFIPQLIIYLYAVIIYSEETETSNLNFQYFNQFIVKTGMYFLLHSFIMGNQSSQGNQQQLQYHLSIGLNQNYHFIGVCIFNITIAYIPLVFSQIIVVTTFKILDFQTKLKFTQQIAFSLIYAIGYVLMSININLIVKKQAYVNVIILIFIVFPIYLQQDAYFRYFDNNYDAISEYLEYFMFPWSIKVAFQGNNQSFIWLGVQFIVLSFIPVAVQTIKRKYCRREREKYFQTNQNTNNDYINEQRNFIDQINDEEQFVIGENIIKIYNQNFALRNVYFRIKLGEILGVFGHNSSGKTSLFNIIVGRLDPTSGKLKYFGKQHSQLSWKDKLNIGYCPQIDNLDSSLTYEQNARVIGRMKGLTHNQIDKHIEVLGKYVHFEGNQQVKLCDLSISERKKSNFIIALLGLPKIFMMDQTSTGVDEVCSNLFLELIKIYARKLKKAVILTSHNVKEGQKYCDRVMILKNGVIKAAGNPLDLKKGAAFQLYKVIVSFSRKQSPVLRCKKKQKVKSYLQTNPYKKIIFEEQYRICYGFDMHKADIITLLCALIKFYSEQTIEQLSIYKYDLQEVAKYYMTQEQTQPNN